MMVEECYYLDVGVSVGLSVSASAEQQFLILASRIVEFFGEFQTIMRPLGIELELGCAEAYTTQADPLVTPASHTWMLLQQPLPLRTKEPQALLTSKKSIEVALLPHVIEEWIASCRAQTNSSCAIVPVYLSMTSASIRISPSSGSESTPIWLLYGPTRKNIVYDFVPSTNEGQQWVSAPPVAQSFHPAIMVQMVYWEGALETEVQLYWSWWFTPGTTEFTAVQKVLNRLITLGWIHRPLQGQNYRDLFGLEASL